METHLAANAMHVIKVDVRRAQSAQTVAQLQADAFLGGAMLHREREELCGQCEALPAVRGECLGDELLVVVAGGVVVVYPCSVKMIHAQLQGGSECAEAFVFGCCGILVVERCHSHGTKGDAGGCETGTADGNMGHLNRHDEGKGDAMLQCIAISRFKAAATAPVAHQLLLLDHAKLQMCLLGYTCNLLLVSATGIASHHHLPVQLAPFNGTILSTLCVLAGQVNQKDHAQAHLAMPLKTAA